MINFRGLSGPIRLETNGDLNVLYRASSAGTRLTKHFRLALLNNAIVTQSTVVMRFLAAFRRHHPSLCPSHTVTFSAWIRLLNRSSKTPERDHSFQFLALFRPFRVMNASIVN